LSKLKLKNILGLESALPELENIDFADYEPLFQTLAGLDDDGVDSLYTALFGEIEKRNPTLVKAGITSARAGQNVSLTALAYSPTLSLSLSTGLSYSYSNGGNTNSNGLGPFTGNLTISGKIPLDFWVTASNVEKQKLAQEQTALMYLNTEDSLELELQTDILSLISQAGQVLSSRRALEYAEKHFDYILELFTLAQRSTSDLSSADALVLSNRNQLIRAQYGLLSALSKIRSLGVFESEESIISLVMNTMAR
jgi:outer membrane protein TolC